MTFDEAYAKHIGLVRYLLRRFYPANWGSTQREDLEQVGLIALFMTYRGYDPAKGKFSTYLSWWLRSEMGRFTRRESFSISVPMHVNIKDAYKILPKRGSTSKPNRILEFGNMDPATAGDKDLSWKFGHLTSAIEATVLDEHDQFDTVDTNASVYRTLIRVLHDKELLVAYLMLGLNGIDYTGAEIGRFLGVSRQRIQQIYKRALAKLRPYVQACYNGITRKGLGNDRRH